MAPLSADMPNTVPADITSFVGRRQDIAAVRQLIRVTRLVTLTGIGGVGKTRLALRVARGVQHTFPEGVCFVELASLKDPALLAHTVIDALGIEEQSARKPMTVLCDYLSRRRMLIVLDNCEHLVEAAANLADGILRAASGVRILATSRQPLRISGERIYPVAPLPAPDPDDPVEPGTGIQFPAAALFADRAAAVIPEFTLTEDNSAAVVRLCHRLEGIPLAIELASVKLRALTVDELVNRLDDRFQFLQEGSRDLPQRQQTLTALIDWSHDLCTPAEQALWARASVFAGGFGIDALEAVCTDDTLPERDIVDTVAGLVDKSIFIREEQGQRIRFRMLETVRTYGQARLIASGDESSLRRRHRDWYLNLMETAGEQWVGPRQREWASLLRAEHANLRRALEYCLSQPGEARVGLRMAAVFWFWFAMGYMIEGRLWLDRALMLDTEPSRERAWALATDAYIAVFQGDEAAATALSEQAYDLAVRLDDPAVMAYAKHMLGVRLFLHTDLSGAIPLFVEARELYTHTDVAAQYRDNLQLDFATACILLGQLDRAAELVDGLLERCTAAGEHWELSWALWQRGWLELIHGELDRAEADLCEALRICRFFHDTLGIAFQLDALACTTMATGDAERAATLFGGTETVWRTLGFPLIGSIHLLAYRDRFKNMARRKIGNAEFDAAFERGSALTTEETLALALREHAKPVPETLRAGSLLTRRQREVADMVAAGLSNKEIAKRLVISQRTAEHHVESILTKLDFNTRTQIASWVMEQPADPR
ncbi:putative ATPase/DNA-binding CsgD family transcriptional regulator [Nocardia sp. GAS34]